MSNEAVDRRGFLKTTGSGVAAAGALLAMGQRPARGPRTEKEKLARLASNTWPLRYIFKTRSGAGRGSRGEMMKAKYGEITMLDMPQFTKDTFPGVTRMDLFSGLFGDVTDDSMYVAAGPGPGREFDPSGTAGRRWLDTLAAKMAATGTSCQHISNNAPRDLSEPDAAKRNAGVEVAKKWLDAGRILGAKSMRVNSGGPRIAPPAVATADYPKADDLAMYLSNCIESLKELADYGGKAGVKVTLENHWGLTANPINIRIIIDEVHHPFCEASPDFCNWEHEYLMYNGLKALAPYAHTNVHAKYWNRWKDNDVRRSVKIMLDGGFEGTFALEYEDGPWDGVEGSKYLYKEVLAAL
ncbi:MAG: xylose isomerase [Acidobacteria bacterium]|nr:MAG: xylose isomerase [Acidobacteriota bacterium]